MTLSKRTLLGLLVALPAWVSLAANDQPLPDGRLPHPALAPLPGKITLQPFDSPVEANSLIVRCRLKQGANYLGPVQGTLMDGSTIIAKGEMPPINPMFNRADTDFELPLDAVRTLPASAKLELSFAAAKEPGELEVYAVLPALFRNDDLAQGIDAERPERNGVWVTHGSAKIAFNDTRGLSGQGCLRADWPDGNDMISLLPGERDWRKYAALRLTLANPLPTVEGRRCRVFFLYDGKTVQRPSGYDSISSGALEVLEEGVKTFELDLEIFRKNNPNFNLGDVRAFQIFWSPVVCGPTTFYIDDVKLLTHEEKAAEERAKYQGRIDALRQQSSSPRLQAVLAEIENRFTAGERTELEPLFWKAAELAVAARLQAKAQAGERLALLSAPAAQKIMRDEMPKNSGFPVKISAAGNERESFQLIVAPFEELKNVTVSASALATNSGATLPASAVTIQPIAYIEVRDNAFLYKDARPGMWPDVLLDNRAFDLSPRLQPYMVTVAVPAGQTPGLYQGTLTVKADGLAPCTVDYQCQVYNFSLPVRGEMKTWFSMCFVPEDKELRRQHYDAFFEHRLNPVSMYACFHRGYPHWFAPALEDVPYCLSRGMNFLTIGYLWDYSVKEGWQFEDEYIQIVVDYVRSVKPQLEKMGAWEITHVNGFDEIMHKADKRDARLAAARKTCAALKQAFPDLKIANIGNVMDISNDLMDTWFVSPVPAKHFRGIQDRGGFVAFYWAYEDPSFMLDQPGLAPRLCAWLTYKEGASGMGYYSTLRPHYAQVSPAGLKGRDKVLAEGHREPTYAMACTERCLPTNPPEGLDWTREHYNIETTNYSGRNGDGTLFHPGPGGRLLPSQRLTNIRDGIEDFEYFKILEKLPGDHRDLLSIGDDIITVRQGDYTVDINLIQERRDAIAKAIENATAKR